MNKAIGRLWYVSAAVFVLLVGSLTYIQFFDAKELRSNPWNARTTLEQFGADRGAILTGGKQIAYSKESEGEFDYQRVYPDSSRYSHVTGYFSQVYGATGIEQIMGEELSGTSDDQFYDRVAALFSGDRAKGASVELTLDPKVQDAAYEALGDRPGAVVALEPKTGRVLALASTPGFDSTPLASQNTNTIVSAMKGLQEDPEQPLVNRAIAGNLYAPASTFKILDTVAALESGKYTADSVLPNPQEMDLPDSDRTLSNYVNGGCRARTQADFWFALQQSCNTPFASVAMDLGPEAIAKTAENFGYGQDLSIPQTVTPSVFPKDLPDALLAISAIGQYDVRTTPLQVAMTSAAIANDGVQMKPQLVESVRNSDLSEIDRFSPEELRRSTSPEVAQTVTDLMVSVVDQGIAGGARVDGVKVAGKTGTAETNVEQAENNTAWFTGFAPADDPKVAVAIVFEDVDAVTGATLTSPSAKKIFEAVLNK